MAIIILHCILINTRHRDDKERAAEQLRDYLVAISPQMSADQFARHNNDINKRIFELLRSPDATARLGAVLAIDQLIDAETGEETAVKITRFANYLRGVVVTSDIEVMRAAANAIGKLTMSGNLATDLVDFEVKRCVEWLQSDRQETRRDAAVLEIKAIAERNPTLLYGYVGQIIDSIWVAIRDPKYSIRVDAASTLGACLRIIYERDSVLKRKWYSRILDELQSGFRSGLTDSIHGSLLVYRELLANAGMFMQSQYSDVCETVLKYKDHKDPLIRHTVVYILPDLAKYNPVEFTKRYLVDSMTHLVGQLKKEKDRAPVFLSIGKIAVSVRSNMSFYLEPILENVREGLSTKG